MLKELLLSILIAVQLTSAATIQGTIYDLEFKKAQNVIIEINTTPSQKIISTNGHYKLDVPPGSYYLTAQVIEKSNKLSAEEDITIEKEGTYTIDLLLFPSFEDEESLIEEENINIYLDDELFQPEITTRRVITGVIILIFIIIITIIIRKRKKQISKNHLTNDLEKVIQIIKKHDKRIYQKELRKELNLSEAKVSLMIADLESQRKIRKIKKGRGNIIILN